VLELVDDELILRAALNAQFERAQDAEFEAYAFNRLLRAAIDTEYISQTGKRLSVGIDWMRSQKRTDDQEIFRRLVRIVRDPMEAFIAHNEYNPHISDIVCSCLFEAFVPEDLRDDFARATILKWGPKKPDWSRFAVFGGVSQAIRAEITYLLASTNTELMSRTRYVSYLSNWRPQEMWDVSREWSILNDSGTFNLALTCLSHTPKLVLGESSAKQVAFVPYLQSVLGKHTVRYIIEKALENYTAVHGHAPDLERHRDTLPTPQKTKVVEPKTEPEPTLGAKPLDVYIDEALKSGVIHKLRKAVGAHSVDKTFVEDYRTHYYRRIKQSGSKWTKQALGCFRTTLQENGWQTGTVLIGEWQGTIRPYIRVPFRGKDIRYVQRFGTYLPKQGEEVLYKPRHGFGIALDLYVVTFEPLTA
jgi:hypothetical protein